MVLDYGRAKFNQLLNVFSLESREKKEQPNKMDLRLGKFKQLPNICVLGKLKQLINCFGPET